MEQSDDGDIVWLLPEWHLRTKKSREEAKWSEAWNGAGNNLAAQIGGCATWADRIAGDEWTMNDWIVEGLFRRKEVCMLVAEANVGKTYTLLDLLIATASGGKWLGHFDCFTGPVYFLSGEGANSTLDRRVVNLLLGRDADLRQFREQYGQRFVLHSPNRTAGVEAAPLSSPLWWARLKKSLEALEKAARPRLWIFDPIMALLSDCEKPEHVKPFTENCRWLAEFTDGCVVLGHHFKKKQGASGNDHSDRIHGPTAFRNLTDNIIVLEADPDAGNLVHAYVNKAKDSEASPGKPAFHIFRRFDPVSYPEVRAARRALGGEPSGLEEPGAVCKAIWKHVAYNKGFDPACRDPETNGAAAMELTPECSEPPQGAETRLRVVRESDNCPPDVEPELTEHQTEVLAVISSATAPISKGTIGKLTKSSKRRVDSAIAELLVLQLITEHPFDTGWGVGYLARRR